MYKKITWRFAIYDTIYRLAASVSQSLVKAKITMLMQGCIELRLLSKWMDLFSSLLGSLPVVVVRACALTKIVRRVETVYVNLSLHAACG